MSWLDGALLAAGWGLRGEMGPHEWGMVALASAIILGLLGPRLYRDIRGWFEAPEAAEEDPSSDGGS